MHRTRGVGRPEPRWREVATAMLERLPLILAIGGSNFPVGGSGLVVRRTAEAFSFATMTWDNAATRALETGVTRRRVCEDRREER